MKPFFKPFLLLFLNVLLFGFNSFSQQAPGIEWQNTIGGDSADTFYSLQQTADGGYILGGWSYSDSSGDKTEDSKGINDYWIVKLNSLGNIQWDKTIGGNNNEYLHSIKQTTDGGYIIGGSSGSNISGDKTENSNGGLDYWIVKLDGSGNIQWQNSIGGSNSEDLFDVQQTTDGGYILGGWSESNISGDKSENSRGSSDYWIVKLNSVGNVQWDHTFGGSSYEVLNSIQQTDDNGYVVGGWSESNISGDKTENNWGGHDYWVIKLNSAGNIIWQNTIGGTGYYDELYSGRQSSDPGFILGGMSDSNISGDKTENCQGGWDYWIVKLDSNGSILWQNTIGGNLNDVLLSIKGIAGGEYILGGGSYSNISGDKTENCWGFNDYWFIKIDSIGNILWQNTIGGNGRDGIREMQQTSDGGYILGGGSNSNISGNKTENSMGSFDYWIVKLLPDTITSISTLQPPSSNFQIFPNPTTGNIHLIFNTKHNAPLDCEIINVIGQTVFAKQLETLNFPINTGQAKLQTNLDVSFLAKGIYVVRVGDGKRWENKKLVLE